MTSSPGTDRDILTQKAYATDEALLVRQRTHDLYSVPQVNMVEWVLDRVQWRGNEQVLDIGAGPGTYFEELKARIPNGRLVGGDLSIGMAGKAAKYGIANLILNADVQALPFSDHCFDVVLANHMLYHVPELDQALIEIHRVLKPEGYLIASTNSEFNMPELEQLMRRTYGLLGAVVPENEAVMKSHTQTFHLEDGPLYLARHFYAVARHDLPGAFVFPAKQPVIDYINSMRAIREPLLPRRIAWEDFIHVLGDQIQRRINQFGELVVSKLAGVLVATDGGGFAKEYIEILSRQYKEH